jgi:hypothetical protein
MPAPLKNQNAAKAPGKRTSGPQIHVPLPAPVKAAVDSRAASLGLSTASHVRTLILRDLKKM